MIRVELPWLDSKLSPNRSRDWKKIAAIKSARRTAYYSALASTGDRKPFPGDGDIPLTVTFYPTPKCRMDRTNMEAACKPYLDGLADAWAVNDKRFIVTWQHPERTDYAGVIVTVGEA